METGHIRTHKGHNIRQHHERPCPLGHLKFFAVFHQLNQLGQLNIKRHFSVRQRRNSRLHPLDIPTVVRAEDINQLVKTTLNLAVVIRDIRRKIGPRAVRFLHRTIYIITVRS